MKESESPPARQNTLSKASAVGGQLCSRPGACGDAPGTNLNSSSLTRSQRIVAEQRQNALTRVEQLKRQGKTEAEAARIVGTSIVSLWRWKKDIVPHTNRCGRKKSWLNDVIIPPELISQIRTAQINGTGNATAWKIAAQNPLCPPRVAAYIRSHKTVSQILLNQTRLEKRTVRVLEAPGFIHVLTQ